MSKNFLADMEIGDLGEQLWAAWVEAKGGECTISTGKCDWDVHDTTKDVSEHTSGPRSMTSQSTSFLSMKQLKPRSRVGL